MIDKKEIGKKSRATGQRFEKKVRADLEKKGWIVDKWTNQVEFMCKHKQKCCARLIPAKPKFIYNPQIKRRIPIGMSSGFPDFIVFPSKNRAGGLVIGAIHEVYDGDYRIIYGIESKMNGILDREEKEKCKWLLDNHIFNRILIASKGEKRGEIIYNQFKFNGGEKMADEEGTQTVDSEEKKPEESEADENKESDEDSE